jgi:hypothetical protein
MKKIRETRVVDGTGLGARRVIEDRIVTVAEDSVPDGAEVLANNVQERDWAEVVPQAPKGFGSK